MYFVFYGLHDTTLQNCIISLYECFAYDITVVVKINLFQCQCQCNVPNYTISFLHQKSCKKKTFLMRSAKFSPMPLYILKKLQHLESFN